MGFFLKYLILARFTLLFALIKPAPGMFVHFMEWNFPHMVVVGFNGTGFHFCGLFEILWHNMFWVFKYSWNIVLYVVNFVLYVVSFIGYTISYFADITTGIFLWEISAHTAPVIITTWMKGVSISIALVVILIATQCEHVPNIVLYKNWFRAILPWPYFIRQSHVFYMHAVCVAVVAFTTFCAYTLSMTGKNTPIVYVQVYAFDTLLLFMWFAVELVWTFLQGMERLVRHTHFEKPEHFKNRKFHCAVSYNTIQVAMTESELLIVRKFIVQRLFMFDCTATTSCDLYINVGDIS